MEVFPQYKDEPIPTQIDISEYVFVCIGMHVDTCSIAYKTLYPILETRKAEIEQTKRRTFKFGATDRHQV